MFNLPELEARLAGIDAERDPLVRLIEAARAYQAVTGRAAIPTPQTSLHAQQPGKPLQPVRRSTSTMGLTIAAVHGVLNTHGPLATSAILDRLRNLEELGLKVDNASNILSARLSNSHEFNTHRGIGWWFADRPLPGAREITSQDVEENEALNGHAVSASEAGQRGVSTAPMSTSQPHVPQQGD